MAKKNLLFALQLTLLGLASSSLFSSASLAGPQMTGEKGAQIYCFMRESGNSHDVSWKASYEVIKRQANSLFKTSPKHAAVMIVEAVVDKPSNYEGCGTYIGDLFNKSNLNELQEASDKNTTTNTKDRYNY